jgi:hypothetical protein
MKNQEELVFRKKGEAENLASPLPGSIGKSRIFPPTG